jgi:hypothetical protein
MTINANTIGTANFNIRMTISLFIQIGALTAAFIATRRALQISPDKNGTGAARATCAPK